MARTLTPERRALKEQAISLRYDYGLSIREIVVRLHVPIMTIQHWVYHNTNGDMSHNITHLEGDCLELLKTIPDKSVDVLLTDPPYSVMNDYDWDKKDDEFYHQWLSTLKPKLKDKYTGFIFFDSRRIYEFEHILRDYTNSRPLPSSRCRKKSGYAISATEPMPHWRYAMRKVALFTWINDLRIDHKLPPMSEGEFVKALSSLEAMGYIQTQGDECHVIKEYDLGAQIGS